MQLGLLRLIWRESERDVAEGSRCASQRGRREGTVGVPTMVGMRTSVVQMGDVAQEQHAPQDSTIGSFGGGLFVIDDTAFQLRVIHSLEVAQARVEDSLCQCS